MTESKCTCAAEIFEAMAMAKYSPLSSDDVDFDWANAVKARTENSGRES